MTQHVPDRFDKQGDDLACAFQTVRCPDRRTLARQIAAALRAAEASPLKRAAQIVEQTTSRYYSGVPADAITKIRALIPPAAAREVACSVCDLTFTSEYVLRQHESVQHRGTSPAPAAETGKAQEAEALQSIRNRITEYLAHGGLLSPDLM